MYAVLGKVQFQLIAYWNGFEHVQGVDYAEHPLFGLKPVLQSVGQRLDTIRINMRFHWMFCSPEAEVTKLRQAMNAQQALRMVLGNGTYVGMFVITSLTVAEIANTSIGAKLISECNIEMKEYAQNNPQQDQASEERANAQQTMNSAPKTTVAVNPTISPGTPLPVPAARNSA